MEQPSTTGSRPYVYCNGDHLEIDEMKFDLCGRLVNQHGIRMKSQFVIEILTKINILFCLVNTVYVPFDVKKLADDMELKFVIGNKVAIWDIEINQIECGHKASIVTPDERQG